MSGSEAALLAALAGWCNATTAPPGGSPASVALAVAVPAARAGPALRADTLPRYISSALSLYRAPPDSADVARRLARWARESGGPDSAGDSLAVAALWRRAGALVAARSSLPRGGGPRSDVEGARIEFAAGHPEMAAARFRAACEGMDVGVARELWLDLRGLATPEEQAAWAGLAPGPDACDFLTRLVDERAWRSALPPAERLAVHYRRLTRARELYWLRRARFTRDLADRLGRPQGLEVDDRGLLYLRLGEPDASAGGGGPGLEANETWAYDRPGGARLFHFAPVSRAFGGGFQPVGDYRLLENLAHATGFTMTSELMELGGARLAGLYASRAGLDPGYGVSAFRYAEAQRELRLVGEPFHPRFLSVLSGERTRTVEDARHVLEEVPDVPGLRPRLRLLTETLRFEEPDGRTQAWLLVAARLGDLTPRREGPARRRVMRARVAFLGPEGYAQAEREVAHTSVGPLSPDDGLTARIPLALPPGPWPLTVAVADPLSGRPPAGNWVQDTVRIAMPGELPRLSDVAVAADSGGSWSRDGRVFLEPDPAHRPGRDGSLHLYFEAYGLRPGAAYEVEVRVASDDLAERIFDLGPGETAFALRFPARAPEDGSPGRHHLRLDLSGTSVGEYLLAIRLRGEGGEPGLPAVTFVRR